jgi:hypothetical protein
MARWLDHSVPWSLVVIQPTGSDRHACMTADCAWRSTSVERLRAMAVFAASYPISEASMLIA